MEVLISFVVLAFGMLGIAGLILTSQKANTSSYARQQAIQSMYNITDRIRANRASAIGGGYDVTNLASGIIPSAPSIDCGSAACTAVQLSAYDTWYWLAKDLSALPAGRGAIVTAASGTNTLLTVTVQWDDSPAQKKLGGSTSTSGASANLPQMSIQTML